MSGQAGERFEPAFWHQHWRGPGRAGSMASALANPYVRQEVTTRSPGTALEVGCGAGAETIALAEAGWTVTAVDTSAEALHLGAERAASSDASGRITWVEADVTTWEPEVQHDLVTCSYVHTSLPQPELLHRMAGWVSSGGALLMVGHAPEEHHHPDGVHPPEDVTNHLESLTSALNNDEWQISAEQTPRTAHVKDGREKTLHDVVLRARRREGTAKPR